MENVFLYILKSSGLLTAFFLTYYFLLRKETFFTTHRWFLLSGLITSVTLPLFFIKKVIFVEKPKVIFEDAINTINSSSSPEAEATINNIDWVTIATIGYGIIVLILLTRVLIPVFSLIKLLHNQKIEKQEHLALIDLNKAVAPFSFFNYIVFNSSLYSKEELQSILMHEKIHSLQKHSIDVLVAKFFCIAFWFNPFMWLYKKAMIQNLEYIADSKAIQLIEDKKAYQRTLLKVIAYQNGLTITNQFYQSLIKKRIVMLNKNQSNKRNSWKYAVVIPALIAFVFLFQVQVVAQEKELKEVTRSEVTVDAVVLTIDKNTTDEEMNSKAKFVKDKFDIGLKFSKVKRNSNGEIVRIKVEYKDNKGNTGVTELNSTQAIQPIYFYKNEEGIGFGKPNQKRVFEKEIVINEEMNEDVEISDSILEIDEDQISTSDLFSDEKRQSKIVIRKDGKKPVVIINGKVMDDDFISDVETVRIVKDGDKTKRIITINGDIEMDDNNRKIDIRRARKDIERAKIEIEKAKPEMEQAIIEMEKARPEMERAKREIERARPEIEKAHVEMLMAKEEMLKAKEEMEKAKRALEKAKKELKNKS